MAREPLVGNRLGSARSRNPQLRCGDRPIRVVSVARMGPIGGDQNRLLQTALAFDRTTVEHTVLIVDSGDGLSDGESARWQDMLDDYAEAGTEVVNLSPGHSLRYRTGASPIDLAASTVSSRDAALTWWMPAWGCPGPWPFQPRKRPGFRS